MSLSYRLFVLLLVTLACKGKPIGRSWSELFEPGKVGIGGPFAAIDMHGDPEAARAVAPEYFKSWHEIPELVPRLLGLVKPELMGGKEPVLVILLEVKGHLPRIERVLRAAWGEPTWKDGSPWWHDPARGIRVFLDRQAELVEQTAYVPAVVYLGEGRELTLGGKTGLLGASLETLQSEHGKTLRVTKSVSAPDQTIAYFELPPTERDRRFVRVNLDLDPENRVIGYDLRFLDGDNGKRMRELFVRKWGTPSHEEDRGEEGWQLDWDDRQLAFARAALDVRVGTKVWPRAQGGQ